MGDAVNSQATAEVYDVTPDTRESEGLVEFPMENPLVQGARLVKTRQVYVKGAREQYWHGKTPKRCEMCNNEFKRFFADGKTQFGPWAMICLHCLDEIGTGLGRGKGQLYMKVGSKWKKVAG